MKFGDSVIEAGRARNFHIHWWEDADYWHVQQLENHIWDCHPAGDVVNADMPNPFTSGQFNVVNGEGFVPDEEAIDDDSVDA